MADFYNEVTFHSPYPRLPPVAMGYQHQPIPVFLLSLTLILGFPRAFQISSIQDGLKQFNENVSRISELHSRSINTADEAAGQRNAAELEELVEDTGALSNTLKRRIKALERQGGSGRDGQIKKQQVRGFADCIL